MKFANSKISLDGLGLIASFLCALHCISLPLLFSMSGWAALHILEKPSVEYFMFSSCICIALSSCIRSYKIHHQHLLPSTLLILGIVSLLIGQVGTNDLYHVFINVFGTIFIAVAHIVNWRLINKSKTKLTVSKVGL